MKLVWESKSIRLNLKSVFRHRPQRSFDFWLRRLQRSFFCFRITSRMFQCRHFSHWFWIWWIFNLFKTASHNQGWFIFQNNTQRRFGPYHMIHTGHIMVNIFLNLNHKSSMNISIPVFLQIILPGVLFVLLRWKMVNHSNLILKSVMPNTNTLSERPHFTTMMNFFFDAINAIISSLITIRYLKNFWFISFDIYTRKNVWTSMVKIGFTRLEPYLYHIPYVVHCHA